MKFLSAKAQMTLGLVCLQISVLCGAMLFGFVPEPKSAVMRGRADLCEAVAIVSSQAISEGRIEELTALLNQLILRNDTLLSAAVRTDDDQLLAELGDHEAYWQRSGTRSTENQVLVPIHTAGTGDAEDSPARWGAVELRFRPWSTQGIAAFVHHPWVKMTIIVSCVTGLFYYFYLKKMLQHLDPSRAVPQRVREALDSLAEGLLVLDRDEKVVLANHAFAEWVGLPADRLTGLPVSSFEWVPQNTDQLITGLPWTDAMQTESAQAGVMIGLSVSDRPVQNLIANASPVLGHDGRYGGVLVSFDDVTQLEETRRDLKVARDAAESAQHEAEQANKAKSDFLARMSHEIRTPMNAILGYTEVLRTGHEEDIADRHRHLDTIHASGEHLLALINDILDLSKIESGQMDLDMQRHSLRELVSQVLSVMNVKAKEKGIGLHLEAPELMPETILTDAVRFRQAVFNLVGNAVKFTEQGCVRIVLSMTDNQKLQVDVVDTGVGIAADAVDKVFQRFTQADASVSTKFGGTGLGLSISRQLARMMGGDITVTSRLGEGSTFSLTVDPGALDGIRLVDPTQDAPAAQQARVRETQLTLPPCRILIVDDEKANRGLAAIHIKRAGGSSVEACDGQEAVEKAMAEDFDIVLMDFNMPVMGGLDATRELRRQGNDVPVIALTANVLEDDRQSAFEAGCNGFLTKPIRMADLVNGILELLPDDLSAPSVHSGEPAATAETPNVRVLPSSDGATSYSSADPAQETRASETHDRPLAAEEPIVGDQSPVSTMEDVPVTDCPAERASGSEASESREVAADESIAEPSAGEPTPLGSPPSDASVDETSDSELPKTVPAPSTQQNVADDSAGGLRPRFSSDVDDLLRSIEETLQKVREPESGRPSPHAATVEPAEQSAGDTTFTENAAADSKVAGNAETKTECGDAQPRESSTAVIADPIESLLPIDDPEFYEIVADFPPRLSQQVQDMRAALQAKDFAQLRELAHWLAGTGETLGFPAFTEPARRLEHLAKDSQENGMQERMQEIEGLASRVVVRRPESLDPDTASQIL